jgi:sulfatase maturation enzyme AslB (radical SAM superfamily)
MVMDYQSAEVVHWFKNQKIKKFIPASVDIDLTNICNQDCFYCNSADHRREKPMQKQYTEYIDLLDKLATWRTHSPNSYGSLHTITYPGGGEPTVLPGYEKVLEHTIDLGFLTSLTTNGTKLNKLIDNVSVDKIRKMAWIGVDIDAGEEELYEQIRRSLTKTSPFKKVMSHSKELVDMGINVDFKVLLCDLNTTPQALENIFRKSKEVGIRLLYLRPAIVNDKAFVITPKLLTLANDLSIKYQITLKINQNKFLPRNYNRCHQMFQFPVFCADGEIYTCCDNKGVSNFSIGHWDQGDFRSEVWLSQRHWDIYNSVNTHLCKPCRPNFSNIQIQKIMDNPESIEVLYL